MSSSRPPRGRNARPLRARFAEPNVVIEDFIDYDDLFPHVDALRHQSWLRQRAGGDSPTECLWWGRESARARTTSTPASATTARRQPAPRAPKPATIRAAVRRVLDDPTYAANVAALRAELDGTTRWSRSRTRCSNLHGPASGRAERQT